MRWSYLELLSCPDDYLEVINDEVKRERAAVKEASNSTPRRRR